MPWGNERVSPNQSAPGRLILVRHAQAQPGLADKGRELTPRGRAQAAVLGEWFRAQDLLPELVLCSDAMRTKETWQAMGRPGYCQFHAQLYASSPGRTLDLVREQTAARVIMVIGHEPTQSQVAAHLVDPELSPPTLLDRLAGGFGTATAAVLELPNQLAWPDLRPGLRLRELFRPTT